MKDITEKLADIHELIVDQVFEDLQNGDRKARQEAMMLLKQNNVTATAAEGTTLRKLQNKLDFSVTKNLVTNIKMSAKRQTT